MLGLDTTLWISIGNTRDPKCRLVFIFINTFMSILSSFSLSVFIVIQVINILALLVDGFLVWSGAPTITALALQQSWIPLVILMWAQIDTVFLALHFYA